MNKKLTVKKSAPVTAPEDMPQPVSAESFLNRGMAFYARRKFVPARQDLTRAVELDPKLVDAQYALGMTLKASGENEAAVQAFRQVISLLEGGAMENPISAHMLRRLAIGEINAMTKGDWDLAAELIQKV